ncbi:TRAP transporter small permease [Rhodovulum sulfidophilum]|uniref:TRAP transporter small permease protein n=2 Tax=Rhodovulum sulfidophilum TaxID=35806 RepID=A0A0D6B9C9_RHOSU|nr:TRAP transporter small permease [Rhodovulum sulfidophilum]MCE8417602.1 TRAP transporter small permease [Rhodovulum sulfidophilum]MCE8432584.1 TRAP transporter small permease [Rhodovulum sulfidophilum]MCE8440344.1 TRAP transporter small permease [Rhodovulum sulfidophilum]MCE8456331.1 TRAP transporter small permease [Rhodovulum sulfidophilum]MCE8468314.1 TRAP transporter small permease [Rhodovulum sulfidophilum]
MRKFLGGRTPEEWLGAILMTTVVALLGFQVVARFGMGRSFSWLEEVSRFAFVWAVYFGFVIAAEGDRHIRVSLHLGLLPTKLRLCMLTLADLLWLGFNAVVIWYGYQFTVSMFEFPYISQTTGINLVWVQMIVPLGFAFMSIRILQVMVRRWQTGEGPADARIGD